MNGYPGKPLGEQVRDFSETQSAFDVMREALVETSTSAVTTRAQTVERALKQAGYRILAPGELDAETLEKAAKVADQYSTNPLVAAKGWDDEQRDYHETGQLDASMAIASAIRALKGGSE